MGCCTGKVVPVGRDSLMLTQVRPQSSERGKKWKVSVLKRKQNSFLGRNLFEGQENPPPPSPWPSTARMA